jgi:hypothetical protein
MLLQVELLIILKNGCNNTAYFYEKSCRYLVQLTYKTPVKTGCPKKRGKQKIVSYLLALGNVSSKTNVKMVVEQKYVLTSKNCTIRDAVTGVQKDTIPVFLDERYLLTKGVKVTKELLDQALSA